MTDSPSVRIAAVGDVNLGRNLTPALESRGAAALLGGVHGAFADADIRFANLECAITESRDGRPGKPVLLRAPRSALSFISFVPFDVVSIANNHIFDFHERGLLDTVDALTDAGIPFVGAGATLTDASKPVVLTAHGRRVAFLGAFGSRGATDRQPGVLPLKLDVLRPLVANAKANADHVVLSAHWGMEFDARVMAYHRDLARDIADMGVDLILGHGAHVFQGIERRGRTLIFYGLGNFLFDHTEAIARHGAVARVTLHADREPDYDLTPFEITDDYALSATGQPPPHAALLTDADSDDGGASDRDFLKAVILSKLKKGPIQGPLAVVRGLRHAPASYYRLVVRLVTRRFRK